MQTTLTVGLASIVFFILLQLFKKGKSPFA